MQMDEAYHYFAAKAENTDVKSLVWTDVNEEVLTLNNVELVIIVERFYRALIILVFIYG